MFSRSVPWSASWELHFQIVKRVIDAIQTLKQPRVASPLRASFQGGIDAPTIHLHRERSSNRRENSRRLAPVGVGQGAPGGALGVFPSVGRGSNERDQTSRTLLDAPKASLQRRPFNEPMAPSSPVWHDPADRPDPSIRVAPISRRCSSSARDETKP